MGRRKPKYHIIEGTSLKISAITYTKMQKGTISKANLAKNIAEYNPLALQGLFPNAKKEFMRLASKAEVTSYSQAISYIKTAYRSALYETDKGRLMSENMKEIVNQTLTSTDVDKLKKDLGMKDLNFDDWKWNDFQKRLESPDGDVWVSVSGNSGDGDYTGVTIDWGKA